MIQYDVKRVQKGVQSFMVSFDFNKTPITQIADYIIIAASKHKSSDIHFDPREEGMMVRFRMDGDCQDYTFIPKAYERNLTTRLKLLANMNITESRLPQDGAIKGDFGGKYLDMRVSALPTNEGEKIVIRILDYERSLQGVDTLGFHPDNLEKIKRFMHLPNGIILTTGATGSGKSTTTYSILQEINKPEKNIITVEDPIEMNIEGINQVQVNAEIGMTFAAALRSILRQDPNIVLIGEIRDSETAQIAIRTAITGHLVLSTIHTNNALATVERLLDMDVERYLLSTALSGIISQRLGKTLCPDCRYQRETTAYEKKIFKRHLHKDVQTIWDANPKGCENCHNGYKGRIAFHEVLELDDTIRDALNNEKLEKDDLRKLVYTNKTITMLQDALIKCLDGKTSFEEVYNAIEIESEEGDNYEEEMESIEEAAPVQQEVKVSDDLLEEEIKPDSENSVNVQVTIPELEAEKEELLKQMNGDQQEGEKSVIPTITEHKEEETTNSVIPTITEHKEETEEQQVPTEAEPVQETATTDNSVIPAINAEIPAVQTEVQPTQETQPTQDVTQPVAPVIPAVGVEPQVVQEAQPVQDVTQPVAQVIPTVGVEPQVNQEAQPVQDVNQPVAPVIPAVGVEPQVVQEAQTVQDVAQPEAQVIPAVGVEPQVVQEAQPVQDVAQPEAQVIPAVGVEPQAVQEAQPVQDVAQPVAQVIPTVGVEPQVNQEALPVQDVTQPVAQVIPTVGVEPQVNQEALPVQDVTQPVAQVIPTVGVEPQVNQEALPVQDVTQPVAQVIPTVGVEPQVVQEVQPVQDVNQPVAPVIPAVGVEPQVVQEAQPVQDVNQPVAPVIPAVSVEPQTDTIMPTISIPTVITTTPEIPQQELQPTTVKPVLQDQNNNVQIPSVTTATTNPQTIQKLGESI